MEIGSRVVVINGILHGFHGEIIDFTNDGKLVCQFELSPPWGDYGRLTTTLKPFDIELENREDLWNHLI